MSNKTLSIIIVVLIAVLGVMVWQITRPQKGKVVEESSTQSDSQSTANTGTNPIQQPSQSQPTTTPASDAPNFAEIKDTGKLQALTLKEGTGAKAVAGDAVAVHYTGWLTNGTKFDSSVDRGQPFTFQLGTGSVIPGWDQGVAGMKIGEKRRLIIPADLGYGAAGAGAAIPPNATLVFDVELLGIQGKQ